MLFVAVTAMPALPAISCPNVSTSAFASLVVAAGMSHPRGTIERASLSAAVGAMLLGGEGAADDYARVSGSTLPRLWGRLDV